MKARFFLVVFAFFLFKAADAQACSPPPSQLYVQPGNIALIIKSREVFDALQLVGAESILEIRLTHGGYVIIANNDCSVTADVEYDPPVQPGLCPTIKGIKVFGSACPN